MQFVADGVFFAELNEVLTRELAEDGYSGVEVRVTPMRTEIIIRATRTQNVLGVNLLDFFCVSEVFLVVCDFNVLIFWVLVFGFDFSRREGEEDQRADLVGTEEVQVPREHRGALRREG